MRVIRAIETCKNQLRMNYPPQIIAYVGYKIIIHRTSDTAIKFYKNALGNIPVNYLKLQISPPCSLLLLFLHSRRKQQLLVLST